MLPTPDNDTEQESQAGLYQGRHTVTIAAVGDVHCPYVDPTYIKSLFRQISEKADILILCGDLTHEGRPAEAEVLAECFTSLQCPIIGVLGNHDYEMGKANAVTDVLRQSGMIVLDGDVHTAFGIDFVGTKGFAGGFGKFALQPWGEPVIKEFVNTAKLEAHKLELALQQSKNPHRVAVLHYAPIRETVEGEPDAIIPFLGSGHLEQVFSRHPVDVVFHGHAHHGRLEGMTRNRIPVFNVAMPLLQRRASLQSPVMIHTLSVCKTVKAS